MAFDTKQLRTCKELVKLSKMPKWLGRYNRFENRIFVRFGQFYVTNEYVLARVEWDEYAHAGDDEWQELTRFMDDDGKLIPFEFEPCEKQWSNDYFSRMFIKKLDNEQFGIDPRLLKGVLNLFNINGINPVIVSGEGKYELSGHNKDVSIKALVMGARI